MNDLLIKSFSASSVYVRVFGFAVFYRQKGDHRVKIMIAHSQLAPLPSELPFHIVSKTIGQGAYAW